MYDCPNKVASLKYPMCAAPLHPPVRALARYGELISFYTRQTVVSRSGVIILIVERCHVDGQFPALQPLGKIGIPINNLDADRSIGWDGDLHPFVCERVKES